MLPKLLDPRPYFANLPDPRRETRNQLHSLQDILMIVLCAVLRGVNYRSHLLLGVPTPATT